MYCSLGTRNLQNPTDLIGPSAEARLLSALETGYGPDARLVLLALHAQVIHQVWSSVSILFPNRRVR